VNLVKKIPFDFVIDLLTVEGIVVRPMFGMHAIYAGNKIVLILRSRSERTETNGIWVASEKQHHESLLTEFPGLTTLALSAETPSANSDWLLLPYVSDDFESSAIKLCQFINRGDMRIGKKRKR